MTPAFPKRELWCIAVAAVIGIIVLPCLNAFVPPDNFFHVSNFSVNIYGKYLCYAVLALSVNLLWGYTGCSASARPSSSPSAATLSACTSCS